MKIGKFKIKDSLIWITVSILIIASVSFSGITRRFTTFKKVTIQITDKANYRFIDATTLESNLIKYLPPFGSPVSKVNKKYIEDLVNNHPAVESSKIYISLNGEMQIEVIQKQPIVRIIDVNGKNFYIDLQGKIFPVFPNSAARVMVANGNIKANFNLKDIINNKETVYSLKKTSPSVYTTFLLAQFITNNEFYKDLIEQIYIEPDGDFEIVPKVGDYIIVLGRPDNLEAKFKKLTAMYKTGFKYAGWNKYEVINLKFDNQVVCTLRN